jgi:AcrR family transcriptional regulator
MTTIRTARERARTEVQAEILAVARRHLAEHGAGGLSLRAVARDLGLVPSAVYRYFADRDALLTSLIVEAYDDLGDLVEQAIAHSPRARPAHRWVAAAKRVRAWAVEHPHQYALLYGSPVPGYEAPLDTVVPGTRVSLALARLVADAHADGLLDDAAGDTQLSAPSRRDIDALLAYVQLDVPPAAMFRTLLAWTQLFGLVSFEVFGQTRGLVHRHDTFAADAALAQARFIGLSTGR